MTEPRDLDLSSSIVARDSSASERGQEAAIRSIAIVRDERAARCSPESVASASNTRAASALNSDVPPALPGEFGALRIGRLSVFPPVVLAPMAGVTNYPYRSLCREFGAGLYVSEMITARGYLNGNRLTCLLASSRPDEKPRSVQIYGSDPVDVGEMARCLVAEGVDHLDMNFGCPVPKVTRHGGGSAIPVKPRLLARLVRAAVQSAGEVPVTIKVRTGIDEQLSTYLDAGRVAESEGAAAIGLHARTAAQLYSGEARWEAIARLKHSVGIPVLGNGDVWECWDALRMMRATGCDGVIVGRGCLGRPWLFAELASVFAGREPALPPDLGAIVAIMRDHALRLIEFFGEKHGMRQMRKWCGWYTKGFHGSAAVRETLSRVSSLDEMMGSLAMLDPSEPFPISALRANRGKSGRDQCVALPHGYLDSRDDDTPPRSPHSAAEIEAWERALSGG
jgi:nifR3 family TIM-barrel protein